MSKPLTQRIVVEADSRQLRALRSQMADHSRKSGGETNRLKAGLQGIGSQFGALGGVARMAMNPIIGLIGATVAVLLKAAKAASEFKTGMAEVSTLVDTSSVSMARLSAGVLSLGARTGVGFDVLTKALYQTISAGVDAADAMRVLDVAARAAVGGATDTKTAVDGITNALNGFGIETSRAEEIADSFFVAVKRGKTTFGELSSNIGQVAGVAREAGVSLEEVLSATAAITLTGVSTSEAMTQLNSVFTAAAKKGSDFAKIGVDIKKSLAEQGLAGTLRLVRERAEATNTELVNLFGRVEGAKATITLTGSQAESFASILDDMGGKAGASQEAFQKMSVEASHLWGVLKQQLGAYLVELGLKILPTVNRALEGTLELMRAFDSPSENLLNVLRNMPGVDPKIIMQLELVVNREQLLKQKSAALKMLQENATVAVNVEMGSSLLHKIGATATMKREIKDIRDLTEDELRGLVRSYVNQLENIRNTSFEGLSYQRREQFTKLITYIEDQIQSINRTISARQELVMVTKELARVEAELAAKETGRTPDIAGQVGPTREDMFRVPESENKILSPEELEAIEKAKEAFRKIAEARRLASTFTDSEREALSEFFAIQKQIADLKELQKTLGAETVKTELAAAEAALKKSEERLRQEKVIAQFARETAGWMAVMAKTFEAEGIPQRGFMDSFGSEAGRSRFGTKPRTVADLVDRTATRQGDIITIKPEALRQLKGGREELDRIVGLLDKAKEKGPKVSDVFVGIASALRSLTRLSDVFGDLNEDVRKVMDGVADLLDNVGNLGKIRDQLRESGIGLGSQAGIAAQLPGFIGAAAGVASAVAGMIGALKDRSEKERKATAEQQQAMQELAQSLREHARSIRASLKDMLQQGVVGGDVAGFDLVSAQSILNWLKQRTVGSAGNANVTQEQIKDAFQQLVDFGLAPGGIMAMLEEALAGGNIADAVKSVLDKTGLEFALQDIVKMFGQFGGSVEGAVERMNFLSQWLQVEGQEGFESFIKFLLDEVGGLRLGMPGDMRGILEQVSGLDVNTAEGRAELQKIIQAVASAMAGGSFDFGGLTPSEVKQLMEALRGFAETPEGAGEDEFTRSVQIARSITEIQANELVAMTDEQIFIMKRQWEELFKHTALLSGLVTLMGGTPPMFPSGEPHYKQPGPESTPLPPVLSMTLNRLSSTSSVPASIRQMQQTGTVVNVGGIQVSGRGLTEQDINQVLAAVGAELRARAADPFRSSAR